MKRPAAIDRDFFARPATEVAPELLGWELVYQSSEGEVGGIIVETEAYMGIGDPASHSHRGPTPRTQIMFEEPAHAYIYFTYGMHYCLNVVTGAVGDGSAVLIRALEPTRGIELMKAHRNTQILTSLCNGPAKLTQALGLDVALNGHDLMTPPLQLYPGKKPARITTSRRIGISRAIHKPWRYTIANHEHLSRKLPKPKTR